MYINDEPLTLEKVVELIRRYPDSTISEDMAELLINVSGDLVYPVVETCRKCGRQYTASKVLSRCPECRIFHLSCGACGQDVMYGDTLCRRCVWGSMHPFLDRVWTAEMFENTLSVYGYRKEDNEYEEEFAVLKHREEQMEEYAGQAYGQEEYTAGNPYESVEYGPDRIIENVI